MRLPHGSIVISLLAAGFSFDAGAGAWTQKKGEGQLIATATAYATSTRYNDTGDRRHQPRYAKQELSAYLEYGATDWLTLGGSSVVTRADDSTRSRATPGDTELFARFRVLEYGRYVVSLQPFVKLPSPMEDRADRPAIGSRNVDAGASLLAGAGFEAFGRRHYADIAAGYRHRLGAPEDQVHIASTLGFSLTDRLTLMQQNFQTIRMESPTGASFTQSPRDDYNLTTVQVSLLYALSERDQVQLGAFRHVAGSNVGAGGGVLLSYWIKF